MAVIYTHTHFNHYNGVKGVIDEADVASGQIPVIAPGTIESFNKYAIGENVITGNAMSRRMGYTFASRTAPAAASAGSPSLAAAVALRSVRRRPGASALTLMPSSARAWA